jgi:type II secretory pathway pseudopilin PulG
MMPRRTHGGRTQGAGAIDLILAMAVVAVLLGLAAASTGPLARRVRGEGAARFVAARIRAVRAEAVSSGRTAGLWFERTTGGAIAMRAVADGNGNGIRRADIASGADALLGDPIRIDEAFPGVRFAIAQPLPGIDGSEDLAAGSDPVRLGASDIMSCTPAGTATPGTVYLTGPDGTPWAVRVLGATARTRILTLDPSSRTWVER